MFSLSNFLNESLQSTSLYREIINEPGGFFKYMQTLPNEHNVYNSDGERKKYANHTQIGDARDCLKKIATISMKVFSNHNVPSVNYRGYHINPELSVEQVKKLNKRYNDLIDEYVKIITHVFDKPKPSVFGAYVTIGDYTSDIFNITDDNFKKITYDEARKDKPGFIDLTNSNFSTMFWFRSDKTLLAISRGNQILAYGTPNVYNQKDGNKCAKFPLPVESVKLLIDESQLFTDPRIDTLPDGTSVEWPRLNEHTWGGSQRGYAGINYYDLIVERSRKMHKVGNPFLTTSKIRSDAHWPKDGYVIVYTPTKFAKNRTTGEYNTYNADRYGYNEYKQTNMHRQKKREEYVNSMTFNKYKWEKDIFGDTIPYSLTGTSYIIDVDKEGNIIKHEVKNDESYADAFNQLIRKKNLEHYRYLLKQRENAGEVKTYTKYVKDTVTKTFLYLQKVDKIKILSMDLDDNFWTSRLYGDMQEAVNEILKNISRIKYEVEQLSEYLTNKDDNNDEFEKMQKMKRYTERLKYDQINIENDFQKLDTIFDNPKFKKMFDNE